MFLTRMLMSVWEKIEDWADAIFYRRPLRRYRHRGLERYHLATMYTYLQVLTIPCFLLPWVFLAVWYVAVVQGCGCYATRPYVEAFCLRPHSSPGYGTPWWLDLWNAGNTHSSITPSRYVETIMTSHLVMKDAGISLRQQALELKAIPSDTIRTDELLSSLDQVTNMVSDLVPQLDKFSTRICMEKEIMTHALRTFVEMHTMTIISSDYEDLTLPSILIFPAIHLMRVIGQLSLWPWLPEAKLYSFQVRAEIQFHKKQLIDGIKAAPDIFDVNPPSTHLFQNSSSQRMYLEGAIDTVTIHQQSIRQIIDGSGSSLWRWIRGAEKTAKLERYHKLGERVRGHLLTVKETMNEYEIYYRRKRSNLQEFRQSLEKSPLIEYSAQSSSAVPPPLLAQVRNVFLLSRGQSSKIDEVGDSRNATHVTSHPHVFLNHLDPINDNRLSSLRSEIAQLCKVQNNIMINSDDLHTICVIYNLVATMSALDDDPLSDFQTSWMVVRAEVIHRWQQRMGFDLESVLRHFAKKYKDYKHGTPVLEHI